MPLVVQQRRRLSPLERYAVDLVFGGTINPKDLMVEVSNSITIGGDGVASTYRGSGVGGGTYESLLSYCGARS